MLSGKKILLGVTGSIAAYKAALILRRLTGYGAEVTVVMTDAARQFVGPLTFQALSGRPVYHDLFDPREEIVHLSLADDADLILVAPATADFLAKVVHGFADNLLSATLLAARSPILVAPAMDAVMWENPAVQENIRKLTERGIGVVDPEEGPLASGLSGPGRLASEDKILSAVEQVLTPPGELRGEVILVTAGPTLEPLDPVRFISNRSSGKMGYAVAKAARGWGGRVILVSGPTAFSPPPGVEFLNVETASEMRTAVEKFLPEATVLIMAAAVADWRPTKISSQKIKKSGEGLTIEFTANDDILSEAARNAGDRIVVGFSAETENLHENALKKLRQKGLDLMVANDVTQAGAGFGVETNIVSLLDAEGGVEDLPKLSKEQVAQKILRRIGEIRKKKSRGLPSER